MIRIFVIARASLPTFVLNNFLIYIFFPQMDQIIDPTVDSTYKDIWMATAKVGQSRRKVLWYSDM